MANPGDIQPGDLVRTTLSSWQGGSTTYTLLVLARRARHNVWVLHPKRGRVVMPDAWLELVAEGDRS
jgi:hypothetical protein